MAKSKFLETCGRALTTSQEYLGTSNKFLIESLVFSILKAVKPSIGGSVFGFFFTLRKSIENLEKSSIFHLFFKIFACGAFQLYIASLRGPKSMLTYIVVHSNKQYMLVFSYIVSIRYSCCLYASMSPVLYYSNVQAIQESMGYF